MRITTIKVETSLTANPGSFWIKAAASIEAVLEEGENMEEAFSNLWFQAKEQVRSQIEEGMARNARGNNKQ